MSDNWIVQNLENALNTWNEKLSEIWQLITQSPEQFKGGTIWNVIVNIHGAVQAIGLALLVLFFVVGVMRTAGNFAEVKRPVNISRQGIRSGTQFRSTGFSLRTTGSLLGSTNYSVVSEQVCCSGLYPPQSSGQSLPG